MNTKSHILHFFFFCLIFPSLLLTPLSSNIYAQADVLDKPNESLANPGRNTKRESDKTSLDPLEEKIQVHILGDVMEPGQYKIGIFQRAADVVKKASPRRSTLRTIQIRQPGKKARYFDLYRYYYFADLSQNPHLNHDDVIFIPKPRGIIRVEGAVTRSGKYELSYEKNLDQVFRLVGGFSKSASKISPIKVIRFSEKGQKIVLNVENTRNDIKRFKIEAGDIIVVPSIVNNNKTFDYSVESLPGEKPFYPTSTPEVFVMGQVVKPGPYPFKSHLTVKDYVAYAGPSSDANLNSIRMIRNGKKRRVKFDDAVESGDILVIKQKLKVGKILTGVSSVLAVTLSVIVLEDRLNN